MARIRIDIDSVSTFRSTVREMASYAEWLISALYDVSQATNEIDDICYKLEEQVSQCEKRIGWVSQEVSGLERDCSYLRIRLSSTPKTIQVKHVEKNGYDENGNPKYKIHYETKANPEYEHLSNELRRQESRLRTGQQILSDLKLQSASMKERCQTLRQKKQLLKNLADAIRLECNTIINTSQQAAACMDEALYYIDLYLHEHSYTDVNINPLPVVSPLIFAPVIPYVGSTNMPRAISSRTWSRVKGGARIPTGKPVFMPRASSGSGWHHVTGSASLPGGTAPSIPHAAADSGFARVTGSASTPGGTAPTIPHISSDFFSAPAAAGMISTPGGQSSGPQQSGTASKIDPAQHKTHGSVFTNRLRNKKLSSHVHESHQISGAPYRGIADLINTRPIIKLPPRSFYDELDIGVFYGIGGSHFQERTRALITYQGTQDQGDYENTCGLAGLTNILRVLHPEQADSYSESNMLHKAIEWNTCQKPGVYHGKYTSGGGTNDTGVLYMASMLGLKAGWTPDLSLNEIENVVSRGGALMMSIYAKELQDDMLIRQPHDPNHWVTVTGIIRDASGQVAGITVRDTGGFTPSPDVVISADKFNNLRKYTNQFSGIAFFA